MSEKDKGESELEGLKKVSSVTPKKNTLISRDKLNIAFVVLVSVVFIGFLARPSHHKAAKLKRDSFSGADSTLRDNLKELEALRIALVSNKDIKKSLNNEFYTDYKPHTAPEVKPVIIKKKTGVSKETLVRMNAPVQFLSRETPKNSFITNKDGSINATLIGKGNNSKFLNSSADISTQNASLMDNPDETVPAGDIIPATLETAVNSDLPGMVRAITTRDVYGLTGRNVLIPRGSTLVGQYNSSVSEGQSRVFVVWNRVLLSNGVKVAINSPGSDAIGRGGLGADSVQQHFFKKFGASILLSLLSAASATTGVNTQDQNNSISDYRMMIAQSMREASSTALSQTMGIPPTMHIHQGAKVAVFVARDLSFHQVLSA